MECSIYGVQKNRDEDCVEEVKLGAIILEECNFDLD